MRVCGCTTARDVDPDFFLKKIIQQRFDMVPWWFKCTNAASWRIASQHLWRSQPRAPNHAFSLSALLVLASWGCATAAWAEQNNKHSWRFSASFGSRKAIMPLVSRFPQDRVECSSHAHEEVNSEVVASASEWFSADGTRYARMEIPPRAEESSHVIFGHLLQQPNLLQGYEIYRRAHENATASSDSGNANETNESSPLVVAKVQFGNSLDGHPGIVHGGILALMLDDVMGFGFWALGVPMAVTANLNINYRQPVMAGSEVKLNVYLTGQEGRKLYWKTQMTSLDDKVIYNEATSIYVIPKAFATESKSN